MYLVALADAEPRPHDLLASPDARGLVASVLVLAACGSTAEDNLDLGEPLWRGSAEANAQQSLHYHRAPGPGRALVVGIQTDLRNLGYDPGPIDGIMGPRTALVISRYQKDHKLLIDGKASVDLAQHISGQPE